MCRYHLYLLAVYFKCRIFRGNQDSLRISGIPKTIITPSIFFLLEVEAQCFFPFFFFCFKNQNSRKFLPECRQEPLFKVFSYMLLNMLCKKLPQNHFGDKVLNFPLGYAIERKEFSDKSESTHGIL